MRRGNHRRTKHEQKYTCICVWCGEHFETSRDAAKTCGQRCRSRLFTFTRALGWEPDQPPGTLTAQAAIDVEVGLLIVNERRRRESRSAYIKATGELPPER